ncbi:MAG TPA: sulfatase-like hydrolase/transferase [Capillimicrobium sp.]|nr:sulfatase-like hydrolase/transferase [Capillimicrobium sp.]
MLNRRQLLQSAAAAAPAVLLSRGATAARAQIPPSAAGMNVIVFITDQERAIQHFPSGWSERNLPATTRLQRNGVTFERAFTNACMCSPARATLLTGLLPAQHGVKYTLEENMPAGEYPQVELSTELENLASVAAAAGYEVVYKGKFHLTKPAGDDWAPGDLGRYGFQRWNPPDAGADQSIAEAGGGTTDHDGRYMNDDGDVAAGQEGVLAYLDGPAGQSGKPFFLIVSLVNPHDVLMYPRNYEEAGYDDDWLDGDIRLPATVDEDLSTKPTAQAQFLRIFRLSGILGTRQRKRAYLRFYANLMRSSDRYLQQILDVLDRRGLTDSTLVIKTADHGEMGLAHGGLRQKNFNVYEETLRIPLVYSNPRLFPRARRSRELVSHVDFLPTIASLIGAPRSARGDWTGVDYARHVLGSAKGPVQDHVVFTFDDFQAGQDSGPYVPQPNHIVSIREKRWKIARYYDPTGEREDQWEMYDLRSDPLERRNIAWPATRRTAREERQLRRLQRKLARVERTQLRPRADTPQPLVPVG